MVMVMLMTCRCKVEIGWAHVYGVIGGMRCERRYHLASWELIVLGGNALPRDGSSMPLEEHTLILSSSSYACSHCHTVVPKYYYPGQHPKQSVRQDKAGPGCFQARVLDGFVGPLPQRLDRAPGLCFNLVGVWSFRDTTT